jgi:hypothetical protein
MPALIVVLQYIKPPIRVPVLVGHVGCRLGTQTAANDGYMLFIISTS